MGSRSLLSALKAADGLAAFTATRRATSDDFIVAPGPQGAVGHEWLRADRRRRPDRDRRCLRDNESFCFSDMTLIFLIGEVPDDVREWHRLCKEALDRASLGDHGRGAAAARSSTAPAAPSRRRASRRRARSRRACRSPTASSTASGTGSGSGARGARTRSHLERRRSRPATWPPSSRACYRQGYGGVRLEDLGLLTDRRRNEVLTRLPIRPRPLSGQLPPRTSTPSSPRSGATRRRRSSPLRPTRRPHLRPATSTPSGAEEARGSPGAAVRQFYESNRPSPSSSSPASSMSPTTASTAISGGPGDKVAYHWEGEPARDAARSPMASSSARSSRTANGLSELLGKGTAVAIYMGMVPHCRSRCSPAHGSGRRTPSSSVGSPRIRSPPGSTTWVARC